MTRSFLKYLFLTFFIIALLAIFPQLINSIRFTTISIVKNIFTNDRQIPIVQKLNDKKK